MPKTVQAKAPGKILWLGGYSILERPNVGFVTTVDAYAHASIQAEANDTIKINVPQFSKSVIGKLETKTGAIRISVPEELKVVKTALEVSLKYASALGCETHGLSLTTTTDGAMTYKIGEDGRISKSGLGTSAAVTVATVGAALKELGLNPKENEALHKLSQLSHSIATDKIGSGFDIAAATYGSVVYSRYSPEMVTSLPRSCSGDDLVKSVKSRWDYRMAPLRLPSFFKLLAASIVGGSAITTSFVKKVNDFKVRDPNKYSEVMKRLNTENVIAINALKRVNKGNDVEGNTQKFRSAFETGWAITKLLGYLSGAEIVDADVENLIEESKINGAYVAKTPGAGGRDAIVALAKGQMSYDALKLSWSRKKELNVLDVRTSNTGFASE